MISLTTLFRAVLVVLLLFFMLLLTVVLRVQQLQRQTIQAEERRNQSYRFAEELRQSSDDLTSMARSYVSTGDKRFLIYYEDILAIRNGLKPRPVVYPPTFWILYPAGKLAWEEGESRPLESLMREAGFSEKEMALLETSKKRSDHLVSMEMEAFEAMEGRYKDGKGEYTRVGAPDASLARRLLFSDAYMKDKAMIMEPIDSFISEVDTRTKNELQKLDKQVLKHIRYAIALLSGFIVVVPFMGVLVRRQIMVPLGVLVGRSREVAQGIYRTQIGAKGIQEFTVLNDGFNEMARAIDREMTELRRLQDELRRNEHSLRKAQQIASVGSLHLDSMEIIHITSEAAKIMGLEQETSLDINSFLEHVHPEDRQRLSSAWEEAVSSRSIMELEHRILVGDLAEGGIRWVLTRMELEQESDATVKSGTGTIQDITSRKLSDTREDNRRYILELIANGTDVHIVLDTIVQSLEEEIPSSMVCAMMADSSGRTLHVGSAPSLPEKLAAALAGIDIEPGSAGCGTAAFTGECIIVEDARMHPNFHRLRDAIKDAELRACWSFPIMSANSDVLGTIDLYFKRSCYPTGSEQRVINSFAHLAGIALSSSLSPQAV